MEALTVFTANQEQSRALKAFLKALNITSVSASKKTWADLFKPNIIRFGDFIYVLNDRLVCFVDYEEDNYKIKNEALDIIVWGDTREEVELAFAFNFHALYENFALEEDSKLSMESKNLKTKLLKLVKKVLIFLIVLCPQNNILICL